MDKESADIHNAITTFSEWMAKRMRKKADEGFTGWQHPNNFNVKQRLLMKAAKIAVDDTDDKDTVDLANFAMMLFIERWRKTFPYQPEK